MIKKIAISIIIITLLILGVLFFNKPSEIKTNQGQTSTVTEKDVIETNTTTIDTKQTHNVSIINFVFTPKVLTINKGDTVVWTNNDSVPHNVVGDDLTSLNSPIFRKKETYKYTFDEIGNFNYTCTLHPSMKGVIIVK